MQFSGSFTAQGGATNSKACVDIRGTTANTSKHIHFQHCVFEKSERGLLWNDKDLKIKWGIKNPILSTKDKVNLTFKEFFKD